MAIRKAILNWRVGKPFLSFLFTLLMEHNALIGEGTVVPDNPSVSELYPRLLTVGIANRLPLGRPQLPARSIETIRNWISAGSPDWAVSSSPSNRFIHPSQILTAIEIRLMWLAPFNRQCACYFHALPLTLAKKLTFCIPFDSPRRSITQTRDLRQEGGDYNC